MQSNAANRRRKGRTNDGVDDGAPVDDVFLLMAVIEAVCKIVSAICTAIVSHQGNENGETTDISES